MFSRGLILLVVVTVCLLAYAQAGDYSKNVIKLTKKNFNRKVLSCRSKKPILVDFYGTVCPACVDFVPEYNKLAASLKRRVRVGSINSDKAEKLTFKYDVQYLPSVFLFQKGKKPALYDPHGERTAEAIEKWVNQQIGGGGGGRKPTPPRCGPNCQGCPACKPRPQPPTCGPNCQGCPACRPRPQPPTCGPNCQGCPACRPQSGGNQQRRRSHQHGSASQGNSGNSAPTLDWSNFQALQQWFRARQATRGRRFWRQY